jgi:hypothetical protein
METVNHLAYSYSRFSKKNFYLIEVFPDDFPSYMKLSVPKLFISTSYDISYHGKPIFKVPVCGHNCLKCTHKCCNDKVKKNIYYFDCKDRGGNENTFEIIVIDDHVEKDPEELESLEETEFYELSTTRAMRMKPKDEVRIKGTIDMADIGEDDQNDRDYDDNTRPSKKKRKK